MTRVSTRSRRLSDEEFSSQPYEESSSEPLPAPEIGIRLLDRVLKGIGSTANALFLFLLGPAAECPQCRSSAEDCAQARLLEVAYWGTILGYDCRVCGHTWVEMVNESAWA